MDRSTQKHLLITITDLPAQAATDNAGSKTDGTESFAAFDSVKAARLYYSRRITGQHIFLIGPPMRNSQYSELLGGERSRITIAYCQIRRRKQAVCIRVRIPTIRQANGVIMTIIDHINLRRPPQDDFRRHRCRYYYPAAL